MPHTIQIYFFTTVTREITLSETQITYPTFFLDLFSVLEMIDSSSQHRAGKKGDRILFSASSYPHPLSLFLCPGSSHTSFPSDSPTPIQFRSGKKSHPRSSKRRKKTRVEERRKYWRFPLLRIRCPIFFFALSPLPCLRTFVLRTTTRRVGGKEGVREKKRKGRKDTDFRTKTKNIPLLLPPF